MLRNRVLFWLFTVFIFAAACLVAFFLVLNSVFADGPLSERFMVFGIIGMIYAIIAAVCGAIYPGKVRWWTAWLCSPAILILILYTLSEPYGILLHLFAAAAVLLPTWVMLRVTNRHSETV